MAFAWPDGIQNKTKRLISQILWTLYLDFEGTIRGSRDAPLELMKAMEGHGVEIKNPMTFRMILPHLDGGKYGKLITRVVTQRRTPEIRLAVRTLPEDSFLPDGAGGIAVDDRLDMQLFGDTAWPARGTTRDVAPSAPARGDTRDKADVLAREIARDVAPSGEARDDEEAVDPARGETRDTLESTSDPARGEARDDAKCTELAREPARDMNESSSADDLAREETRDSGRLARGEARDSDSSDLAREVPRDDTPVFPPQLDATIRRLDGEVEDLLAPLPVADDSLEPHEMLDVVGGLMAELGELVRRGPTGSSGPSERDWTALLEEKHELLEQLGRYMRRIKDAEARLAERNKEIEGARLQLQALNSKYDRLEANNRALLAGERPAGQHLRAAERFIAETPSDRPDHGRSRPTRPNGRTTGSESVLAYSAGG